MNVAFRSGHFEERVKAKDRDSEKKKKKGELRRESESEKLNCKTRLEWMISVRTYKTAEAEKGKKREGENQMSKCSKRKQCCISVYMLNIDL